jgi:hypothetical protein
MTNMGPVSHFWPSDLRVIDFLSQLALVKKIKLLFFGPLKAVQIGFGSLM